MSIFPQQVFTLDNTLVRTGPRGERQHYDSQSLARKSCGPPKGVYVGFTPSVLGSVLTLSPDPGEGYSGIKVQSDADPAGMDITTTSAITLDFASTPAAEFLPDGILVKARAAYNDSDEAEASIFTQQKTLTETVFTVGASAAPLDLSTLAPLGALLAGTLVINVTVDGFGADVIADDGNGNLVSAGPALPAGGTVDYTAGTLTGITANLSALSSVFLTRSRCAGPDEVLICVVTGVPAAIGFDATPPDFRDTPIAFSGCTIPYGFLESGSVEALEAAVEILNEVIAARIGLDGTPYPLLKDRLDADLGGQKMAERLGKVLRVLRSNQYSAASGVSEISVTGSFTDTGRSFAPKNLLLDGTGSELQQGAVAAPNDSVRNVAVIIDTSTNDRLITSPAERKIVIGRIEQELDFILDGVLTFTTAINTVAGDAQAQFTTQVAVGDAIQGPDGKFYEVESVEADDALTLTTAFQGATTPSAGLIRRRILLKFRKIGTSGEEDHTLTESATIEFYFPAFLEIDSSNYDNALRMHRPGERPPVPSASVTVPGKIALADAGSPFAGSINLQNNGVPVGGGPFHTINFTSSTVVQLAPGVLDVAAIGPVGPVGPGAGPGPTGPTGPPGVSYDAIATFEPNNFTTVGGAGVTVTHTVDFGFSIGFVSGGIASYRPVNLGTILIGVNQFPFGVSDRIVIDDIRQESLTSATIEATGDGSISAEVKLYLCAAGEV